MQRGGQGGEGPRALDGAAQLEGLRRDAEDRAEGEQAAVVVGHHGAVQAGDRLQDRGLEVGQVHAPDDVVERSLGVLGREVVRVLGDRRRRPPREIWSGGARSWGTECSGSRSTTNSAPSRDSLRLSAAWKIDHGQAGPSRAADRLAPDRELAGDVEQPPPRVAEAEHQRPLGEDLDLLRGGQHQADVPAGPRGLGVVAVGTRAGMDQRLAPLDGLGPPGDVDQPRQVPLAIDQEDRPHAVAEPVEPLDRRQPSVEVGRPSPVLVDPGRPGRARCRAAARPSRPGGSRRSTARRPAAPRARPGSGTG